MRNAIILGTALLTLAACGKSNSITVPDGKGGTAKIEASDAGGGQSKATITTDQGSMSFSSSTGSAKFTEFAPQYPGAKVLSSSTFNVNMGNQGTSDPGSSDTAQMVTSDAPEKVMAFYKAKLDAAKMPIAMQTNRPEGSMIMAMTADKKRTVMISTSGKDGKTEINLVVGTKNK